MLLADKSRSEILAHCRKKWDLRRASGDGLIRKANVMIREDIESMRESKLTSILKKQENLFERIIEDRPQSKEGIGLPNYGAARQVLMDIAKLMGLETVKISIKPEADDETKDLSDEELDKIIEGNA